MIILEKGTGNTARYSSQVIFEDLNDLRSIYVDNDENKLFVLTTNAIYRVDI
ncbi:hypothetical protein IPJ72_06420 [Candidatus Peregrinibacteria bacterium]|nr:MAG: hypothetical protein IPJ72_06420 [Candidatus Peregrinibacteria bacterium]